MSWDDEIATAKTAARAAGQILQEWSHKFTVSEKSRKNLVTEADLTAQNRIFEIIHDKYPNHSFLGEEDLAVENAGSEYRWIIDPLDGTANYVHGFPYYCVSIALEFQGALSVGVIFDPNRDEMFTASSGNGAFMNDEPIQVSKSDSLYESMCVASLPVGATGDEIQIKQFLRALPQVRSVQRLGSAALNLCYVASSRLDAYWSGTLKPWDQAAGAVIVTEAGGRISKMDNSEFDVELPDMLASNGNSIHAGLSEILIED